MNETSLQAYRLACARGDRQLFCDINFEIKAGEALWLAGANGSGKTSLLRLLCGLTAPVIGEVRWGGRDIQNLREEFYQDLIYFSHASSVKDDLTAWENVLIGSKLSGRKCNREYAHYALNQVGLMRAANSLTRTLSQGQRKRVALARLCIHPVPKLVILDEPFTGLDQDAIGALCGVLNQHLAQGGIVVYTTHQELTLKPERLHFLDLSQTASC